MSHYSSRYKRRKRGGFFGTVFKILILLAILGGLAFLAVKLGPSMLSGRFNSSERFNVVLTSPSKTAFLSLDAGSGKATVIDFPPDLYVLGVAHGYGQYPIGKVFEVGELDKRGGQVLSDTLSVYLGVPVDGYVRLSDFSSSDVKGSLLSPTFLTNARSNVNLWDRILLLKALTDLRFDKVTKIDLSKKSEPLLLADGSMAKVFLQEDLDNVLDGAFSEEAIVREGLRVQVVNTTGIPGLGNAFARVISGLGATVIDVTSTEPAIASCQIDVGKKLSKSKTVVRVAEILGCETKANEELGRADVIVYLGSAQAKILGN